MRKIPVNYLRGFFIIIIFAVRNIRETRENRVLSRNCECHERLWQSQIPRRLQVRHSRFRTRSETIVTC